MWLRTLGNAATLALAISALLLTVFTVRRSLHLTNGVAGAEVRTVEEWTALVADAGLRGSSAAAFRIVEFADFQCPACAEAAVALDSLLDMHPGQIAVVQRHFPIPDMHPHAVEAAIAVECARDQGYLRSYHDVLYESQDSLGIVPWQTLAQRASISDLGEFTRCLEEQRHRERVLADVDMGLMIGVRGTPTYIFNGKMVMGVSAVSHLRRWIEEAIQH